MESTPDKKPINHESVNKSSRRLIVRILIYGLLSLVLINILSAIVIPIPKPIAVLRVERERLASRSSSARTQFALGDTNKERRPATNHALSKTTATLSPATAAQSLLTTSQVPPPLKPQYDQWNKEYHTLLQDIATYEQEAARLPFQEANRQNMSLFMALWRLSKEIDTTAHDKLTGSPEAWGEFTSRVFPCLERLWMQLAEDRLADFVRYKRWVAAARFCEFSLHDSRQAMYYWRQLGGREGYFQAATLAIGRPWDFITVHSRKGMYWTFIKMSLIPSPSDEEADWAPNSIGPTPLDKQLPYR